MRFRTTEARNLRNLVPCDGRRAREENHTGDGSTVSRRPAPPSGQRVQERGWRSGRHETGWGGCPAGQGDATIFSDDSAWRRDRGARAGPLAVFAEIRRLPRAPLRRRFGANARERSVKGVRDVTTCPVCHGVGDLPEGFYSAPRDRWGNYTVVSDTTAEHREQCRTCAGRGVIWESGA